MNKLLKAKLVLDIPKELHTTLKLISIKRGITLKKLLIPLLEELYKDYKNKEKIDS